jgi:hypothetical protein
MVEPQLLLIQSGQQPLQLEFLVIMQAVVVVLGELLKALVLVVQHQVHLTLTQQMQLPILVREAAVFTNQLM